MKKILLLVVLFVFAGCSSVLAFVPINFEWLCNTDNPAGYRIHWSADQGGPYESAIDVGLPVPDVDGKCYFSLSSPPPRLNYYRATAYDIDGFPSSYSDNEVVERSKHSNPGQFKKRLK